MLEVISADRLCPRQQRQKCLLVILTPQKNQGEIILKHTDTSEHFTREMFLSIVFLSTRRKRARLTKTILNP
jgi:hypothetical protein